MGAREAAEAAIAAGPDLGHEDYRIAESRVVAVDAAVAQGDLAGAEALVAESGVDRPGRRPHFQLAHAMRSRAAIAARSR